MSPSAIALSLSVTLRAGAFYATGVVIDPARGVVLTSAHLLEGVQGPVRVEWRDGRVEEAALLEADGDLDAAFLAVGPRDLPSPALGEARRTEAGERVAVAGTPAGRPFTLRRGRATGGRLDLLGEELVEIAGDFLPGDSGAPVVDARGRLVGIVDCVRAGKEGYVVPIETLRAAHPEMFGAQPASPASAPPSVAPASSAVPASIPAS